MKGRPKRHQREFRWFSNNGPAERLLSPRILFDLFNFFPQNIFLGFSLSFSALTAWPRCVQGLSKPCPVCVSLAAPGRANLSSPPCEGFVFLHRLVWVWFHVAMNTTWCSVSNLISSLDFLVTYIYIYIYPLVFAHVTRESGFKHMLFTCPEESKRWRWHCLGSMLALFFISL